MNKQINNISQHSKTVYLESKEIWKPIKGYEGIYEISNKNRVKALEKIVIGGRYNCPRVYKEKILKNTNGDVSLVKNKINKTYDVYTLKQIHFNGFEPKGKRKEVVKNDKVITRRKFVQDLKSKLENKTSKYVGVSWSKKANKWRSAIKIDKYDIHLGLFEIEEDAKIMYEKAVANIDLYKGIPKHFRSILNIIHLERLP